MQRSLRPIGTKEDCVRIWTEGTAIERFSGLDPVRRRPTLDLDKSAKTIVRR
jgi:hypothetical protein